LGLRVPLVFTSSKYYSQLEFGNYLGVTKVSSFQNTITKGDSVFTPPPQGSRFVPVNIYVEGANGKTSVVHADYLLTNNVGNGHLVYNYFYLTYLHALKQSLRDFNPKFGQYLYFDYYSTPYGGDFRGSLWDVRALAFFPGLFKHHSLYFKAGYQSELSSLDANIYAFRNQLFKPRGYSYPNDNTFYTLSANYEFPIWYADVALGPVLNVQRVKANLFYDYGQGSSTNYFYDFTHSKYYYQNLSVPYPSAGVEVTFDINVMRLLQQVEVGFRISDINANIYNPTSGLVFEFIIGNIPF
jgi:hypothetical protein